MSKIKAVIFDLDGTLVDSEPNYFLSDYKLLADYGIAFDMEMKKKYVGIGSREMMADIKKMHPIPESVEILIAKKNRYYEEIARGNTVVFPEMKKFVELLKKNHYPLAIASGSSPEIIEMVLTVTNVREHFDILLSAEHVEKGKPAPDIFVEAAKRLGIPAENCLVLEDSQYGVEAAKSALMHCVAIPYFTEEPLHASYRKADMIFKRGMPEFTAEKVLSWISSLADD